MIGTNSIFKVLTGVDTSDEDFTVLLDKIIKITLVMYNSIDEFGEDQSELNGITQLFIEDLDYNVWFEKKGQKITYGWGIKDHADLRVWLTKNLIIKMIKQEIMVSDAYMRGLFRLKGNLSLAMQTRNSILDLLRYLNSSENNG